MLRRSIKNTKRSYIVKSGQPLVGAAGSLVSFSEKTYYGGAEAGPGDEVFVWRSGIDESSLHSVGRVEQSRVEAPFIHLKVKLVAFATITFDNSDLAAYRDTGTEEPLSELSARLFGHAHNKCAAISADTADYLREYIGGYRGLDEVNELFPASTAVVAPAPRTEAAPSTLAPAQAASEFKCPTCGSTEIVKSSAFVEQGTTTSQGTIKGVAMSRRGPIAGVAKTRSVSTTGAASKNAAPVPQSGCASAIAFALATLVFAPALLVFLTGGKFLLSLFLGIISSLIVGGVKLARTDHKEIAAGNQRMEAAYSRQWYCRRCGGRFSLHM